MQIYDMMLCSVVEFFFYPEDGGCSFSEIPVSLSQTTRHQCQERVIVIITVVRTSNVTYLEIFSISLVLTFSRVKKFSCASSFGTLGLCCPLGCWYIGHIGCNLLTCCKGQLDWAG